MAKVQVYRTKTSGVVPLAGNLVDGQLAINQADKRLYTLDASGSTTEFEPKPHVHAGSDVQISTDPNNAIQLGTDDGLYAANTGGISVYSSIETYKAGQVVYDTAGSTNMYLSLVDGNTNNALSNDSPYWRRVNFVLDDTATASDKLWSSAQTDLEDNRVLANAISMSVALG